MTSDNNGHCPRPKGTTYIASNSIDSGYYNQAYYPKKPKVKVKIFSSTNVRDMYHNIKRILRQKPEYIILHVSNNDVLNLPPNEY